MSTLTSAHRVFLGVCVGMCLFLYLLKSSKIFTREDILAGPQKFKGLFKGLDLAFRLRKDWGQVSERVTGQLEKLCPGVV